MPELPEVETVRRGLSAQVTGRRIAEVRCFRPDLRYPLPDFRPLSGRKCRAVRRRAKYLQFVFEDSLLVWHLGMSGRFHVLDASLPIQAHEHVRIVFDNGQSLRYMDARRFGYAGILPASGWQAHPWFARLGPEPLEAGFGGEYLFNRARGRKTAVKPFLMDAGVVVGVGNIYASEALFRAGIHPARAAGRISRRRLEALAACVREVLAEAIAAGGSTISDFVQVDGRPGYFAHAFQVYGREGAPCPRCAGAIRRITQSARSSFYCPKCQR